MLLDHMGLRAILREAETMGWKLVVLNACATKTWRSHQQALSDFR